MILPNSLIMSLLFLGGGALLWSIWIVTFRSAIAEPVKGPRWRFEYYCFDFALGAVLAGLAAALTLGTLGWDGFAFRDELALSGKRQELFAILAGMTFTMGNMLMLGGASVSGVLLSVPIAAGLSFAVGSLLMNLVNSGSNVLLLSLGLLLTIIAAVFGFLAFYEVMSARNLALIQSGKAKSTRRSISTTGFVLSTLGGLFMSGFFPLMDMARVPDVGMGPYTSGFLVAAGILVGTLMFNMFFMNLPVRGKPAEFGIFFSAPAGNHLAGALGGALWLAGTVGHYVAARSEGAALVLPAWRFAAFLAPGLVAGILGLFIWNELKGTEAKTRSFAGVMVALLLFAAGAIVLAAPGAK